MAAESRHRHPERRWSPGRRCSEAVKQPTAQRKHPAACIQIRRPTWWLPAVILPRRPKPASSSRALARAPSVSPARAMAALFFQDSGVAVERFQTLTVARSRPQGDPASGDFVQSARRSAGTPPDRRIHQGVNGVDCGAGRALPAPLIRRFAEHRLSAKGQNSPSGFSICAGATYRRRRDAARTPKRHPAILPTSMSAQSSGESRTDGAAPRWKPSIS
jgi:hypothetical protein